MKTQQRVEETVMQILYDNLLLIRANSQSVINKVTKEIIELFDQQTANLKLRIAKQAEYLAYLKRAIHSESIIDNITAGARDKFDAEISSLQEGKEKEEKPLTKEEAQKCYPDLCFCEQSTYTKGVCDKCGKQED